MCSRFTWEHWERGRARAGLQPGASGNCSSGVSSSPFPSVPASHRAQVSGGCCTPLGAWNGRAGGTGRDGVTPVLLGQCTQSARFRNVCCKDLSPHAGEQDTGNLAGMHRCLWTLPHCPYRQFLEACICEVFCERIGGIHS